MGKQQLSSAFDLWFHNWTALFIVLDLESVHCVEHCEISTTVSPAWVYDDCLGQPNTYYFKYDIKTLSVQNRRALLDK
jgi:hypothetical protein